MMKTSSNIMWMYPAPCTRCGYCCTIEPCPPAQQLTGQTKGKCRFLDIGKDVASCRLIEFAPEHRRKDAMKLLGMGCGCCMLGRIMDTRDMKQRLWSIIDPKLKREIAMANAETQRCTGRNEWASPFPGLAHDEEGSQDGFKKTGT